MIQFEHVTKRFGARKILDDINFDIQPGEFVSIVGNSGAGKSTIINMLLGEERPSFGHITVDGTDLGKLRGNRLQTYRQHVGAVFQDCKLLAKKTVFE
ncbi:cell division ATP-binding protein FtsE, partial [Candidatus Peregrinibacteria bacterium CG11_big_fil_rev_8_21_14_0_20_46_8]